ncbi:aldehyde dehydrogenase (NADP(+)) [Xinfangfangia sp. CPCC 101601]|uniref:Aldehyde dehydrogenase (NADP(+)) n=1 Tax=Pseudogemmobacter lacusdianii TaxID=3069608 RepID=A0ABU0VW76_9RHOB|nr:aldehyde dehydrogenase (NADP(+)) [Xinfangfangia sp. CPCC 101601]MDQ2066002.1 aldehyde dehydrogenase (NADP(+)) [Xinfangfangia sp. CPCC 101601]
MTFVPHGRHLIAGDWVSNAETFPNAPVSGEPMLFSVGTVAHVDAACAAAEVAFAEYSAKSREERALFLEAIAEEIEARAAAVTEIGTLESGLPQGRLEGERGRTTGQLRLFASHIRDGAFLDRRTDVALPERQPAPRPEIRLMQLPVGPVAVFGASNFPLAFSTAGGDTAAALAAGCPVVVKGHSAHPGTGEIIAEAVKAAVEKTGMPKGVFSLIQGGNRQVGEALVKHPAIKAVGFTGSLAGGRALFNLCAQRPNPIPFFGELGSVNPMFLMPAALEARGEALAKGWAGSLTMGAGQFCTNPGIAVVIDSPAGRAFHDQAREAVAPIAAQVMLTDGIASAYRQGKERIAAASGVQTLVSTVSENRQALPNLFAVSGDDWLANHALGEEVFGPLGLIVTVRDFAQMLEVANALEGQLTCTLHVDAGDKAEAAQLLPVLAHKAGRILANGFPTGVEVSEAMVHGGPYPASTNFGATSVGTMSIRRFLRPVSFQNIPVELLPEDLR